ncbi:uncharacterized protein BDV17DRAFT_285774 [Aspergillus undulatus]|uniref:uncharacterized protein n=1 Tax=Aspergillus undulatus TaxID=1810928 RepID=UPI003CCCDBBD
MRGLDRSNETGITRVTCDQELNNALRQPFQTSILWKNYTQHYPLHGIPTSIPEFINELRQLNVEYLETSEPLNFLDIQNQIFSCVPVYVRPLKVRFNYADHVFFLVSSQHSLSPLHSDTGGKLTYIVRISGPRIMPPGYPHAVFTPEHSLTFGGHFYTLPHLGSSLRILAIQAKFNHIFSNESLTEQDYLTFLVMLEAYKDSINYQQMASIASSGKGWGITDQHQTREEVSEIRWDGQEFWELQ